MGQSWDEDLNGAPPSFQELLAAEHATRAAFVADYMSRRRLSRNEVDAELLENYLTRFASQLACSRSEAERLLDDLLRLRAGRSDSFDRGSHGQLG